MNDLIAASLTNTTEAKAIVSRVSDTLIHLAEAGAATGARVYVTTIIPPGQPDWLRHFAWSWAVVAYVREVNDILRRHAWPSSVHLIDFAARLDPDDTGLLPSAYRLDTLHLNQIAYECLADVLPFRPEPTRLISQACQN